MRIHNFAAFPMLVLASLVGVVAAHAQTYSVLYKFGTKNDDPQRPYSPGVIAQGRDGNIYSTSLAGGVNGFGAAFKVTPAGKLTVLHSFDNNDGNEPFSGFTLNTDGSLYGTSYIGGASDAGTVFEITLGGKFTVLHNFVGDSDGGLPYGPPVAGSDGSLYGTTSAGGGTLYRIMPSGSLITVSQLDNSPTIPLVQGTDGNFYGTTYIGGKSNHGTIFKITPKGKLTVLHSLSCNNACEISSALIQASDGYFYGTAYHGGTTSGRPGTIFKVSSRGSFSILHSFDCAKDGCAPIAGLVQATDGNFYGSTTSGGRKRFGTIYKITPQGSLSVLYSFNQASGEGPPGTLLQHTNGIFYGDTAGGGLLSKCGGQGCGVFYSMDVGLKPFVSFIDPLSSGKVGKTIQILGQGFTGTAAVSFNGTASSYTIKSDTFLTAIVPPGATTGFVTVTTPSGTLKSNKQFIVQP